MRLEDFTKKELVRYIRLSRNGEERALTILFNEKIRRIENDIRKYEGLYKVKREVEYLKMAEKKKKELKKFQRKEEE